MITSSDLSVSGNATGCRRSSFAADEVILLSAYGPQESVGTVIGFVDTVLALTAELSSAPAADFMFGSVWHSPVSTASTLLPETSDSAHAVLPVRWLGGVPALASVPLPAGRSLCSMCHASDRNIR